MGSVVTLKGVGDQGRCLLAYLEQELRADAAQTAANKLC